MRILVVGGTGLIGSHAARLLAAEGEDVVIAGRTAPEAPSLVEELDFLEGDYAAGDFTPERLRGFDAVVMAAGNDIRHVAPGAGDVDLTDFWERMQSGGIPAVAEAARAAEVGRFIQVGSCYHVVRPEWAETNPYVRARRDADERARALTTDEFAVVTLNPPPIVGMTPGIATRRYSRLFRWARGEDPKWPLTAPPGGTNFVTVRSLAEAIRGALWVGRPGEAYLIGDENLSYRDYFQTIVDLVGGTGRVEVVDAEHWFLPDRMIVPGRSAMFSYEPDPAAVALLGYRRDDIRPMLAAMVAQARTAGLV
ncbi:MAG: NAD-dependent epimerase/dehydratase family protein [Nocardioides sp.]|uniref:NAD-dependent epimerase/dehydratase family protein n=1 Tax=Nocardioides sp. TaxID=35761 RepID=UPI0039E399CA